jgi:hypothetical protein
MELVEIFNVCKIGLWVGLKILFQANEIARFGDLNLFSY